MVMGHQERRKIEELLKRFTESDQPLKANMAVFSDEEGTILYAGIITDWPMIVTTDIEFGEVKEMDATKEPFAGKAVRFSSPILGN